MKNHTTVKKKMLQGNDNKEIVEEEKSVYNFRIFRSAFE